MTVRLNAVRLTAHCVARLCAALSTPGSHGANVRRLMLRGAALGPAGAAALMAGLRGRTAPLELLDLRANALGDEGAAAVAGLLDGSGAVAIAELWLCSNGIGPAGGAALLAAVQRLLAIYDAAAVHKIAVAVRLRALDTSSNEMPSGTTEAIAAVLRSMCMEAAVAARTAPRK